MKRKLLRTLLLALSMLPLVASAADMRNWSVTLFASDGSTAGTGTFSADYSVQFSPAINLDVTVGGTRYQYDGTGVWVPLFYKAYSSSVPEALFGLILFSTAEGPNPCIEFNQINGWQWHHATCRVTLGVVSAFDSLSGGGSYIIEPGPTATPATLGGFYPPVDSPAVGTNLAKAGQTIPLKFYAETAQGPITDLTAVDLSIVSTSCEQLDEALDAIESYSTATSVPLENLGGGYYQYNWKTTKGDTGCRVVTLTLPETYDADALIATIKFRK